MELFLWKIRELDQEKSIKLQYKNSSPENKKLESISWGVRKFS